MSFVRKPDGGCRSVVDLSGLNDYVERPVHPFPAPKDILATIPHGSKKFAVFDCLKGYWQIELEDESKDLTTFLTEFGRYRYNRAPMGLNASGDEFCRRTDEAMSGIDIFTIYDAEQRFVICSDHKLRPNQIVPAFQYRPLNSQTFQFNDSVISLGLSEKTASTHY